MLHAFPLMVALLVCFEAPPSVRTVPEPTFKTPIDYTAWARTVIQGGDREGDDASSEYDAILKKVETPKNRNWIQAFGFRGPTTDLEKGLSDRIEPWDPAKYPEWEEAHKKTAQLREAFYAAAARPYWAASLTRGRNESNCVPTLLDVDPVLAQPEITLARGVIDAAWRAPDGKIDVDDFMKMVRANFGLARQLERDLFSNPGQQTLGLRAVTYYSVTSAIRLRVLDAAGLERLGAELDKSDAQLPAFETILAAEEASIYDALQAAFDQNGNLPCGPRAKRLGQAVRDGTVGVVPSQKTAARYFAECSDRSSRPYDAAMATDLESLRNSVKKVDPELYKLLAPMGKYLGFGLRMEAQRRAVRCIVEIHVYGAKNGRWPKSLNDLPEDVVKRCSIDPFSGKPFVYRAESDGFILYSVAQDAADNGGKHDPRWAEREPGGDYVFWSSGSAEAK